MPLRLEPIADEIVEAVRAGEFHGAPLQASRWGGTGEVVVNGVMVLPPAVTIDPLGEGWRLSGTDWPLILHSGRNRGEPSDTDDFDLLDAVLDALSERPTLNGIVAMSYPATIDRPRPVSVGQVGKQRTILRRDITLHIDH